MIVRHFVPITWNPNMIKCLRIIHSIPNTLLHFKYFPYISEQRKTEQILVHVILLPGLRRCRSIVTGFAFYFSYILQFYSKLTVRYIDSHKINSWRSESLTEYQVLSYVSLTLRISILKPNDFLFAVYMVSTVNIVYSGRCHGSKQQ